MTPTATISKYTLKSGETRWRVVYRTPERSQTQKRGFKRRRDAELWWAETLVDMRRGAFVPESRGLVTVETVYRDWIDVVRVKPKTMVTRKSTWRNHVAPRWATARIGDVRKPAVQAWVNDMEKSGVGAATIYNAVSVMRMVCGYAVEEQLIVLNPAAGVKHDKPRAARGYYLTHDQLRSLTKQLGDYGVVARFLGYTGLRFGELTALRVSDVDLLRRLVVVEKSATPVGGKLHESTTKTDRNRTVPFPRFLLDDVTALTHGKSPDDYLFTSPNGGPLRIDNFRRRQFAPAVRRCVEQDQTFPRRLTIHDLRHTAASLAVSAGANVKAVQRMLGHASATMTLDVYADLFDEDLQAIADAFDETVKRLDERGA